MRASNQSPRAVTRRTLLLIATIAATTTSPLSAQYRTADKQKATTNRLVTGPANTIRAAIASGATPTAEILLTPVANTPTGPYGHAGYYSDADINGQRLTVSSGGGRTFWNMQLRNWGPAGLHAWQGRVDSSSFLGTTADCGTGPGSCIGAGDIVLAEQPCVGFLDCLQAFGETPSNCTDGFCDPVWFNTSRLFKLCDWFSGSFGCLVADDGDSMCWLAFSFNEWFDDYGETHYRGTLALDIPQDAKGLYTLKWNPAETFMLDNSDPAQQIPLTALIPGELEVRTGRCCYNTNTNPSCAADVAAFECDQLQTEDGDAVWEDVDDPCPADGGTTCDGCLIDGDCDDNDICTRDFCTPVPDRVFGQCTYLPRMGWVPDSQCCDPTTGEVERIIAPNICTTAACEFDENRGRLIITPLPVGTLCTVVDVEEPCAFDPVCQSDETCAGTFVDDADVMCEDDIDCQNETGIAFSRCVGNWCTCSLEYELGACCAPSDARGCANDRIQEQCECFGCVWTPAQTCNQVDCSTLVQPVPTTSTWTLAILALTLMAGLAIKFPQRVIK